MKITIILFILFLISTYHIISQEIITTDEAPLSKTPTFQGNKFGGNIGYNSLHNTYSIDRRGNGISINLFFQKMDVF